MTPATFTEMWKAWGPLVATVFGGMSLIISALVIAYRDKDKQLDAAKASLVKAESDNTARYISTLEKAMSALGTFADSQQQTTHAIEGLQGALVQLKDAFQLLDKVKDLQAAVEIEGRLRREERS